MSFRVHHPNELLATVCAAMAILTATQFVGCSDSGGNTAAQVPADESQQGAVSPPNASRVAASGRGEDATAPVTSSAQPASTSNQVVDKG